MKIAVGADHGGFALKEEIKAFLINEGHDVTDMGTHSFTSTDYNDHAIKVAEGVRDHTFERGILVCGTGVGMSIMANKVQGVRAALVHDVFTAKATRLHNDSNVLTMGGRVVGPGLALEIVKVWVDTAFSHEERHERRVQKIDQY
ncbi:ribose 5-phosphate isomerase B [Candidatus Xianfuyuplasma coldseepsis]|uniref:Ribose 5-phosphate isomerase B n=1 Tax=Candidatus Xianfuyuplasma coldseepsis TaxID=2782163 RepID=A0A7L7KUH3_9MOLU|nr:ribose 5-phosphate isomerase B [Xianfuyuplasma coldseepsis]QMS85418.1 ribose 5-phosphate isomerase B [Xianfuyuplasma coldseepsis]